MNTYAKTWQTNNKDVVNFLNNYSGNEQFVWSCNSWFQKSGWLSDKQTMAIRRKVNKPKRVKPTSFSKKVGDSIIIKRWFANTKAKEFGMPHFFRNLKIEGLHDETARALQVTISFISEITSCCHFCGKSLDTEVSKATGVGPVCAKKYLSVKRPTVDNAQDILNKIEQEAQNAGQLGPMWIPKSQIITKAMRVLYGDKDGDVRY